MGLRTWKFVDPIYGMGYILHCGDFDASQQYLKRMVNKDPDSEKPVPVALTTLIRTADDKPFVHVWLRAFTRNAASVATLAHECLHATMMTFDHIGQPVDGEHDEAAAYYLGWLVEECYRRLAKR